MKSYLTAIVSSLISLQITAQYTSMLQNDNTWKCQSYGLIFTTYQFSIGNEVTLGEFVYKQLIYQSGNGDPVVYTLLREDILEQRVYIFQPDGDAILYDFSLEVNDVATVYGLGGMHEITVTDVSTTIVNGTSRKKITFSNDGPGGEWIEGIGSLFGVPDAALGWVADYSPQVTCFYEGNTLAWDNPDVDGVDCSLTLAMNEYKNISFDIFPNPAQNSIRLDLPSEIISTGLTINIFNITGNLVSTHNGHNQQINIESLAPGIYLLECKSNNGLLITTKFSKI